MLHVLKYKRAIIQTNTGYGKTETIATLINYAHNELGKSISYNSRKKRKMKL